MLYEEALYTVLYRAGTMGPDQVDDQETLLGYLQQVSPPGSFLPAGPARPLPALLSGERSPLSLPALFSTWCCPPHPNNEGLAHIQNTPYTHVCAQADTHTG